jgi:precorrin-6B methylase 2
MVTAMNAFRTNARAGALVAIAALIGSMHVVTAVAAQQPPAPAAPQQPFEPTVGQSGKDVVWVPTPLELVEKMLDMAAVTPRDVVMDLGSGDGRNIIAAAKRGARAVGVEFNPDMVRLSQQMARNAGVGDKATFIEGDMYAADISRATVMAMFLLPDNLRRLRDKFMDLRPGSRLVMNTFAIPEWEPDVTETVEGDCTSWCKSLLYYVPARVAGQWKATQGELTLTQSFQNVTGTLTMGGKTLSVSGKLRGTQITLEAGGTQLTGEVNGDRIQGASWSATRAQAPLSAAAGSNAPWTVRLEYSEEEAR